MLVIIVLVTPWWFPGTLASQFIYVERFISMKKQRTKDLSNKNFQTKNQTKVDGVSFFRKRKFLSFLARQLR